MEKDQTQDPKRQSDVKALMRTHYLEYASYVICERAIPNLYDGLKPVQRRILYILWKMQDDKLHKVANVAGQTMALHPHGDAPITEAMINMANKGYLLDTQGNFGNIYTGDPAAAGRYIETRLSLLAKETMFNPELTEFIPSYDGRTKEPVCLPAKIPLVLMQGADGIAVGMATHIMPHNFVELLEAEIALLEGKELPSIVPDFPTGGIMDASDYQGGKGKIKLRAKIEIKDAKTIMITEICHGTTTESLIRTIDEAAKRGKIKIESINDYTAEKVEIEIKLPRGCYAEDLIDSLYAYTECEVSITPQMTVIKDNLPCELGIAEILQLHLDKLQGYLRKELELEQAKLNEKIFQNTLERIFIENRLYKNIETISSYEKIHQVVAKSLEPFHSLLARVPTQEDREKLLNIPIRRISRFDLDKNQESIASDNKELLTVAKHLGQMKKYAAHYLRGLITRYGKDYPRKTEVNTIENLDMRAINTRQIKVFFDPVSGFVGTKVTGGRTIECTNFDKLLLLYKNGSYMVINVPEKQYIQKNDNKIVYVGVADKKTAISAIFRDPKKAHCFIKRFVIKQFMLEKLYRYFDEKLELCHLTDQAKLSLELHFIPKIGQRVAKSTINIEDYLVKGVSSKGVTLSRKGVKKVTALAQDKP